MKCFKETLAFAFLVGSSAFSIQNRRPSALQRIINTSHVPSSTSLKSFPDAQSSLILADTAEWRQYVPLVVSCGVIVDILLGSPIANLALAPMKRATEDSDGESSEGSGGSKFVRNPKERVDADAVAAAAVQKARYSMELRRFLDENKTDEQKYEDIRKKIDQQSEEFDEKIEKM